MDIRVRSKRRERVVNPRKLLERLCVALGQPCPASAADVVGASFPCFTESPETFRDRYLLREVLRKYPAFDLGIDREAAAINSLLEQEDRNRATNDRIMSFRPWEDPRLARVISLAQDKIDKVLGPFDPVAFANYARFGPRATAEHRATSTSLVEKLSKRPHVTLSAYRLAEWYVRQSPSWTNVLQDEAGKLFFVVHEHDKVTCVPKNAKTDRTVSPQPGMNALLQLGVGGLMRERLSAAGIDLNRQSINQSRARLGSIMGHLATVDLSNASNSVSCALVYLLCGALDHDKSTSWQWYTVMDSLRTTSGWIGKADHRWELFSSMGNGFTFELESLLFYALTWAVCVDLGVPPDITVYGDDIICPVDCIDRLREVFSWCGFQLNMDKSFWGGKDLPCFRESCGSHWLDGTDVAPFYVDSPLDCDEKIILLANNIVRWSRLPYGRDGRLQGVWRWVVSHLSKKAQDSAIPFGEANDGLIKDFDEAGPSVSYTCKDDFQVVQAVGSDFAPRAMSLARMRLGYRARVMERYNRPAEIPDDTGYLIWLYQTDAKRFTPRVHWARLVWPFRDPYRRYKKPGLEESVRFKTRTVASWVDVGPWLA